MSAAEAAAHAAQDQARAASAGGQPSAWNAAGTFEERDVTAWVRSTALPELLLGQVAEVGGTVATVTGASCTGEAHQWVVRGKARAGFELQLDLQWEATVGGDRVATGTARCAPAPVAPPTHPPARPPARCCCTHGALRRSPCPPRARAARRRVPNASWDELDELVIEVKVDAGGEAVAHERAKAAAAALVGALEVQLGALLERIREKGRGS